MLESQPAGTLLLRTVVIFAAIMILAGACRQPPAVAPPAAAPEVAMAAPGEQYVLSAAELASAKARAEKGDADEALRVAVHYFATDPDGDAQLPWLEKAAQNGNFTAMQNLAAILSSRRKGDECQQAINWLKRIKRTADAATTKELLVDSMLRDLKVSDNCSLKPLEQ